MHDAPGGDRPHPSTRRAGIRAALWAAVYAGLAVITVLACAFGTQGRFCDRYDDNVLIIAMAVLACSLVLGQAERRPQAQGKRLHRINAYLNGTSSPMLMGVLAALAGRTAGPAHGGRRLVGEPPPAIGQLGGLWSGVTVVRLLQDPHLDMQGGVFRART